MMVVRECCVSRCVRPNNHEQVIDFLEVGATDNVVVACFLLLDPAETAFPHNPNNRAVPRRGKKNRPARTRRTAKTRSING